MATREVGIENKKAGMPSLPDVYRSIPVARTGGWLKKFLSFAGPGYLVSVGYMDPGNWSTDLSGGSRFGYRLLWVVLASNLMAILLQTLCARLGLVTGRDLAQACRDYYKRPVAIALWLFCEVAIVACDLAEMIGSAVALQLLFGIPLLWGVLITGADVLALLALMRFGFRKMEAIIVTLVATVAGCFAIEMFFAQPNWIGVAKGILTPSALTGDALFISLGILGATVMPHNLYLHSSVVQTRASDQSEDGLKQAIRFNTADTAIALGMAFFVNASILVLGAAIFHRGGVVVEELQQAHLLLKPIAGGLAATLFAVALLASGQSSTITGTLAGQIVMEGFLRIRIAPWLRRLITRGLALIPAIAIISAQGGKGTIDLLNLSQVVLSMQLSFAIFPLMMFTSDRNRMGQFANPVWLKCLGYGVSLIIAGLNFKLLFDKLPAVWLGAGIFASLLFAGYTVFVHVERPRLHQTPSE